MCFGIQPHQINRSAHRRTVSAQHRHAVAPLDVRDCRPGATRFRQRGRHARRSARRRRESPGRHTTSARVVFSHANRPRLSVERSLTAARMPLTLMVVTITDRPYPEGPTHLPASACASVRDTPSRHGPLRTLAGLAGDHPVPPVLDNRYSRSHGDSRDPSPPGLRQNLSFCCTRSQFPAGGPTWSEDAGTGRCQGPRTDQPSATTAVRERHVPAGHQSLAGRHIERQLTRWLGNRPTSPVNPRRKAGRPFELEDAAVGPWHADRAIASGRRWLERPVTGQVRRSSLLLPRWTQSRWPPAKGPGPLILRTLLRPEARARPGRSAVRADGLPRGRTADDHRGRHHRPAYVQSPLGSLPPCWGSKNSAQSMPVPCHGEYDW